MLALAVISFAALVIGWFVLPSNPTPAVSATIKATKLVGAEA